MLTNILLIETANANLLLGFMPESLGLLLFGAILIAAAIGLRRAFGQSEENNFNRAAANANQKVTG